MGSMRTTTGRPPVERAALKRAFACKIHEVSEPCRRLNQGYNLIVDGEEIAMYQIDLAHQRNRCAAKVTLHGGLSKFWSRATKLSVLFFVSTLGFASATVQASVAEDQQALADLDTKYQKAVEQNDAKTMAEILADDFVLVEGDGKRSTKADLVDDAKSGKTHYVRQDDSERTVAVFGDTGVVTAKLRAKGIEDGVKVAYLQWFTDVYVRTPNGWRYVYAQASLSLPSKSRH
jgi:ketosteroid isomerase-like protein